MTQSMGLSSELFLICHDPFTGRAQVSRQLLEYGVAAAGFADLIIAQRLVVVTEEHHARLDLPDHVLLGGSGHGGPPDEVGRYILGAVREQQATFPIGTWIASSDLASGATDLVVRQLVDGGVVRHVQRGLRRKRDEFPPAGPESLLTASHALNQVCHMLVHPEKFDFRHAALAVLVGALGATQIFTRTTPDARDAPEVIDELLQHSAPLRSVAAGLRAAVAAASVAMGGH